MSRDVLGTGSMSCGGIHMSLSVFDGLHQQARSMGHDNYLDIKNILHTEHIFIYYISPHFGISLLFI